MFFFGAYLGLIYRLSENSIQSTKAIGTTSMRG